MLAPIASLSVESSSLLVTITTGKVRRDLAHVAIDLEPALARHLLVEQHDVERPAPQHLDRVVGVGRPLYVIALGAQEDAVRLEKLTFIVHPEYRFWGV